MTVRPLKAPKMRGLHCYFAAWAKEPRSCWTGQTPSPLPLYPLPPLPALASEPSSIFSLYISPDPLSFPIAPTMKTTKKRRALWCKPEAG